MKRLKLALFFLALASSAFAQGVFVPAQTAFKVVNGYTTPIAKATITVCGAGASGIPCSPALVNTVFSNTALTQPLSNPFTSDAFGNYQFASVPGTYTVTVTASGFAGYSYQVSLSSVGTVAVTMPNSSNGTLCNGLAQIDQTAGATTNGFLTTASGTQSLVYGVVVSGCGTTGSASVVISGPVQVVFDTSSVTVGDAVGISSTPGSVTDLGSANPTTALLGIIGVISVSPTGQLPTACTIAPGCWINYLPAGGSGGGGGSSANAVVTNPATTAANSIQGTAATVQALTPKCPAGAASTVNCLQVLDNTGTQVFGAQQNDQVLLGGGANKSLGSNTTSNSDLLGLLSATGTSVSYTFSNTGYSVHPVCFGQDLTSGTLLTPTYTAATSVSFATTSNGHTVQYICLVFK